jgi:membrane dipeptidase
MDMNIIDLHCDALLKLWESRGKASFANSPEIDTNKQRLKAGEVKAQAFAIWVDPSIKTENKFQVALEQIDLFYREVLEKNKKIKQIKEWSDFDKIGENEIGAMLTLEGVDPIGNDLTKLNILYQLGVRSIGLTWNQANLAADGAGEARGAGLTNFGKEIVAFNNSHKILTDVSHLCEKAFWDVIEVAQFPIASHSNTKKYCDHPRNLSDEQAKALFQKGGMIHVVYCPDFVKKEGRVTIADLIQHIDHLCSLGGVQKIGLGSDFDGISAKIEGLTNAAESQNLINELLKHFKEEEVKGFAYQNFLNHRPK